MNDSVMQHCVANYSLTIGFRKNWGTLRSRFQAYFDSERFISIFQTLPLCNSFSVKSYCARWTDAKQFGFELFGQLLQPEDFTPAVVISICDCIDPAVRKFGRDLLTQCFQSRDGQEYLVKFSEHPANDMQVFASHYLESYAGSHPDRLQELQPYFVRVLAQVNRRRVAKQRIFAFLDSEATQSEAAATIVTDILTRQSVAVAIGDRARAIGTLLKIHQRFPHLDVPIQVKSVAVRT
jgi:hypothetical protein